MTDMTYTIRLVMGDYGGDGHGRSLERFYASNLDQEEIKAAYEAGTQILGVDLSRDICAEYEDHKVSIEQAQKFKDHGCMVFDTVSKYNYDPKKGYDIWHDEFVNLYLFVCKLGNKDFEYEEINDKVGWIDIGGYGLFE